MGAFYDYIGKFPMATSLFRDTVKQKALTITAVPNKGLILEKHPERATNPVLREFLRRATSTPDLIEIMLVGSTMCEGPKVFRPRQIDFEMLEHTSLNIACSDYVQPFPTVVIELPEGYASNRNVCCPHTGQYLYGEKQPSVHEPTLVIVQHIPEMHAILTMVMFSTNVSIKTSFVPEGEMTLEELIESFDYEKDEFNGSLETTEEEWELTKNVMRASLNYCLLVDELGSRRVGPENPTVEAELRKQLKKAKESNSAGWVRRAETALLDHPAVFELDQHVKLYRTVEHDEDLEGVHVAGQPRPPHHRRGHYRMQACGAGRAEHKRVRISPVFVNKHLFLGDMADARATYT